MMPVVRPDFGHQWVHWHWCQWDCTHPLWAALPGPGLPIKPLWRRSQGTFTFLLGMLNWDWNCYPSVKLIRGYHHHWWGGGRACSQLTNTLDGNPGLRVWLLVEAGWGTFQLFPAANTCANSSVPVLPLRTLRMLLTVKLLCPPTFQHDDARQDSSIAACKQNTMSVFWF